jgi:hypothetical protein
MKFLNPYMLAIKIGGIALACAALMVLVFSWSSRGQTIERMQDWQNVVVRATSAATVEPVNGKIKLLDPAAVPEAIAGLKRTADSCLAASKERTRIVDEAVKRADAADLALANVQTILRGEYSSAEKRIKALEQVKAAPTPDLQCKAVADDSRAAWEGWK